MANSEAALAVIDLPGGASIKMEALDPTTSAPVAGVKVTNWTISAIDLSQPEDTGTQPFELPGSIELLPGPAA